MGGGWLARWPTQESPKKKKGQCGIQLLAHRLPIFLEDGQLFLLAWGATGGGEMAKTYAVI